MIVNYLVMALACGVLSAMLLRRGFTWDADRRSGHGWSAAFGLVFMFIGLVVNAMAAYIDCDAWALAFVIFCLPYAYWISRSEWYIGWRNRALCRLSQRDSVVRVRAKCQLDVLLALVSQTDLGSEVQNTLRRIAVCDLQRLLQFRQWVYEDLKHADGDDRTVVASRLQCIQTKISGIETFLREAEMLIRSGRYAELTVRFQEVTAIFLHPYFGSSQESAQDAKVGTSE